MRLKQELVLASIPTVIVMAVLFVIAHFGHQRLLFASLASSAFLIYLDPRHATNQAGTLFWAQVLAALVGELSMGLFGPGYVAAAVAMGAIILLMIPLNIVHPPAIGTALGFAFRSDSQNRLLLFGTALLMIVLLVVLERVSLHLLARMARQDADPR